MGIGLDSPGIDLSNNGQAFNTGIGPVSVANGSNLSFMIANPVGSGKRIYLDRVRMYSSTTADIMVPFFINPTTNLPATSVPSYAQFVGAPNGVAQVTWANNATPVGGGIVAPYNIVILQKTLTDFQIFPTRILPPGTSLALTIPNSSGGALNFIVINDWFEI